MLSKKQINDFEKKFIKLKMEAREKGVKFNKILLCKELNITPSSLTHCLTQYCNQSIVELKLIDWIENGNLKPFM
jgi:hypothetical protein